MQATPLLSSNSVSAPVSVDPLVTIDSNAVVRRKSPSPPRRKKSKQARNRDLEGQDHHDDDTDDDESYPHLNVLQRLQQQQLQSFSNNTPSVSSSASVPNLNLRPDLKHLEKKKARPAMYQKTTAEGSVAHAIIR